MPWNQEYHHREAVRFLQLKTIAAKIAVIHWRLAKLADTEGDEQSVYYHERRSRDAATRSRRYRRKSRTHRVFTDFSTD